MKKLWLVLSAVALSLSAWSASRGMWARFAITALASVVWCLWAIAEVIEERKK
jgi:hypothetical protein